VDAGGQFGPCSARGDQAQFREIRTEGDLDGQPQSTWGRALQGDPLGAVRVPRPFDDHVRVRADVGGRAQRADEACPVGRDHPGLHG